MWHLFHTLSPSLSRRKNIQRCSPITCLPPEILSYIFRLYLLPLDEQMNASSLDAQSPSSLTQVCRTWREIVESDPHFWTSIHFYFPADARKRPSEEDARRIRPIFDLHLKHSGTLPLSFAFTDLRCKSTQAPEALTCLLISRLRKHSRRWKRISLHMSGHSLCYIFSYFTPCDLPSLEHLYVHNDPYEDMTPVPSLDCGSATNLKSFASNEFFREFVPGDLKWGRLVEVSFNFMPSNTSVFSQQYGHLAECQNVITCSLGMGRDCSRVWQTITLPSLRTLRVRRLSKRADTCLFGIFILPQLETLEIDSKLFVGFDGSYTPWDYRVFSNLLARSGCALRHLSIQDVDFSNDELVRCLALSPTLTSLCFIPYPRSQDIGDVILKLDVSHSTVLGQPDAGTGPLVPELREITLATSNDRGLGSIMAMIRSRGGAHARAGGVAALRRVEVVFFRKPRIRVMCRPRGWLKEIESFRENLEQWASEVEIENENEERRGGVVTKVGIRSAARAKGKVRKGTG